MRALKHMGAAAVSGLAALLFAAIVAAALYGVWAFAEWSFDPGRWDSLDRGFAAFIFLVAGCFGGATVFVAIYVRVIE